MLFRSPAVTLGGGEVEDGDAARWGRHGGDRSPGRGGRDGATGIVVEGISSFVSPGGNRQMERTRNPCGTAPRSARRRSIVGVIVFFVLGPGWSRAYPQETHRLDRADRAGKVMGLAPGRIQVRLTNSGDIWLV